MDNKTDLTELDLTAFIYQQSNELKSYLSSDSVITILPKNAKKVIRKLKINKEIAEDFSAEFCYEFNLEAQGTKLKSYGLANSPIESIIIAKNKMLKQLILIQNEIISSPEHINKINKYINGGNIKH